MLYLDLTSLTVAVGVGVTPPMLLEDGTVEAKDVETAVVVGVLLVLRLLRLVGPDSKSILLFLLRGLPSLFTLTMSPPLCICWRLCCCCCRRRCLSIFCLVLPGGLPGPRFFSVESCFEGTDGSVGGGGGGGVAIEVDDVVGGRKAGVGSSVGGLLTTDCVEVVVGG